MSEANKILVRHSDSRQSRVMVEGKGFVDCALNPDATLARTKWQIVAFRGLACPFHALPGAPAFPIRPRPNRH